MFVSTFIAKNNSEQFIGKLKKENVAKLFVFGSSLHSDSPNDIDLLIEINEDDPLIEGESLLSLWDFFESYFGKKVDLITSRSIKNPIFKKEVDKTKQLIYAEGQQEVFT